MRKTEPIKVTHEKSDAYSSSTVESHPAFGQASFSRRQGYSGKLYGSALDHHDTHITLTVHKSELIHDLSSDWYFRKEPLIEVNFSASQFAELITTMNVASGVPCTLRYTSDEGSIPGLPDDTLTESNRIEEAFNSQLKEKVEKFKEYEKEISEILKKKNIGKADRDRIQTCINQASRFFTDSAPFAVVSMVEAKDKLVSSAKAEIEASLMHAITKAGIKTLKGETHEDSKPGPDPKPPSLPGFPSPSR